MFRNIDWDIISEVIKIREFMKKVQSTFSCVNIICRQGDVHTIKWNKWKVPVADTFKLNVDGSWIKATATSTAGGVLHDRKGDWNGGFSVKLGTCSEINAEAWAILHGLRFAWHIGMRILEIASNSLTICKPPQREILWRNVIVFSRESGRWW